MPEESGLLPQCPESVGGNTRTPVHDAVASSRMDTRSPFSAHIPPACLCMYDLSQRAEPVGVDELSEVTPQSDEDTPAVVVAPSSLIFRCKKHAIGLYEVLVAHARSHVGAGIMASVAYFDP